VLSLVGLTGCAKAKGVGQTKTVTITAAGFTPSDLIVPVGTTVVWTNKDSNIHTVSSTASVFDSGVVQPGKKFTYTFDQPGTYRYGCSITTSMSAEVLVQR
jgi:plastocyanin